MESPVQRPVASSYLRDSLWVLLGVALLLPAAARAQRGALTLPQNLGELVGQAATIVRGHVASARVEPHPDFPSLATLVVTFRVEQVLKGKAGSTFTFRQYLWDVRDRYDAAGYRKGQHLLLLLTRPSQYGLSSPAGLSQGRFWIRPGAQGRLVALNGVANTGLFRDLMPTLQKRGITLAAEQVSLLKTHRSGPIHLDALEALIGRLAARQ